MSDPQPETEPWTVPFAWGPEQVSAGRFLSSSALFAIVAAVYFVGIIGAARISIGFEAVIAMVVPAICLFGGYFEHADPRIKQLMWFESGYNLIALGNKLALVGGAGAVAGWIGWLFVGFFVFQVLGFLAFEFQEKRYLGMVPSAILGIVIFWWFSQAGDVGGVIDAQGRFLMWGTEAPVAVRAIYAVWLFNAAIGDMNDVYPRAVVVHVVSVAVALASGEFFHARLLTASHLFVLDLAFGVTRMPSPVLPETFVTLPVATRRWFFDTVRPPIIVVVTLGCAGLLVAAAVLGLDLGVGG